MTVVEFLLARIAEDEEWAMAASGEDLTAWLDPMAGPANFGAVHHHIARHDSARVLAECAAKRRIVEDPPASPDGWDAWGGICELLASVYADHPDFRQEWV